MADTAAIHSSAAAIAAAAAAAAEVVRSYDHELLPRSEAQLTPVREAASAGTFTDRVTVHMHCSAGDKAV
jgi:hypothetical protein